MLAAFDAGQQTLVTMSDCRLGAADSKFETELGDGAAALDTAKAGDKILFVTYGEGCDAMSFTEPKKRILTALPPLLPSCWSIRIIPLPTAST